MGQGDRDLRSRRTKLDEERREFVLLSDVLGVSLLVDMVNTVPGGTLSSVSAPFHISGAPPIPFGADMKRHYEGEVLLATGVVRDKDGSLIDSASIDIWQKAPNRLYSGQNDGQDTNSFQASRRQGRAGAWVSPR